MVKKGARLVVAEEPLHRQIHSCFMDDFGVPSSSAFLPTKRDEGHLSVSQGSQESPKVSYDVYVNVLKLDSCAVFSVTVGECDATALIAYDAPRDHNPAHAVIDFSPETNSKREMERRAKKLKNFAIGRGCMYKPAAQTETDSAAGGSSE